MLWIILVLLILVLIVFFVLGPDKIFRRLRFISFFAKGSDAGFSFREISILWKAALEADLHRPEGLYFSIDELDKTLNILKSNITFSNDQDDQKRIQLLKKLFEFRKKIEFDKPKYKNGLRNTHEIPLKQVLKIRIPEGAIYTSVVTEMSQDYITVTYPSGPPLPTQFIWRGPVINVYFWKNNDAGYFFQTSFLNYKHKEGKFLRMRHGDTLLRTQKRKSLRAQSNFPSQIYILKSINIANDKPEYKPGLKSRVVDISEDGVAVRVRGLGKKGIPMKIQLKIGEEIIVVCGVTRSVDYDDKIDVSILRLEILPPNERTLMAILAYVYDVDRSRQKMEDQIKNNALSKHKGAIKDLIQDKEAGVSEKTIEEADDEVEAQDVENIPETESESDKAEKKDDSETSEKSEELDTIGEENPPFDNVPDLPDNFDDLMEDDHLSGNKNTR